MPIATPELHRRPDISSKPLLNSVTGSEALAHLDKDGVNVAVMRQVKQLLEKELSQLAQSDIILLYQNFPLEADQPHEWTII